MGKIAIGAKTLLYPMPAFLIGANVDDKPNFMVAAWCGIVSSEPPTVAVGLRQQRYTSNGVRQNQCFSINVASTDQVEAVDYCGTVSGAKVNKVEACQFKLFYGKLQKAPLIEQCPVNLECKVVHTLDLGSHTLVIGRIEETYVSEDCLTDGKPDVDKIKPFVYIQQPTRQYRALGAVIAQAHVAGREPIAAKPAR